ALVANKTRGLPSGDAAENTANRHADSRRVALAEHVARHDLAGGEHVLRRGAIRHHDARIAIHAHAEIGEGDAGPHRIGVVGRRVDRPSPVRFWRREAFRPAVVQHRVVEFPGNNMAVELAYGRVERRAIDAKRRTEVADGVCSERWIYRWHEEAQRL